MQQVPMKQDDLDLKIKSVLTRPQVDALERNQSLNKAARMTYLYGESLCSVRGMIPPVLELCKRFGKSPDEAIASS